VAKQGRKQLKTNEGKAAKGHDTKE